MDKLQRYLSSRPAKFKYHIGRILSAAVFSIERESKLVTPVDTGRLRSSIGGGTFSGKGSRTGGSFPVGEGIKIGDYQASIGPTVMYAPFVHKREPFMKIGLDQALPAIKSFARQEIADALSE